MKTLIAGGDSFTAGTELQDLDRVWAKQLANQNHMKYISAAEPGIGNEQIAYRVINAVTAEPDCVVVVMWTFLTRYDYLLSVDTGDRNSPWYTLFPHHADLNSTSGFESDYINRAKSMGVDDWAKSHYKLTGDINEAFHSLWQVLQLQNFLKVNNIPYMFTGAENWMNTNQELQNQTVTRNLVKNIDFSKFVWFNGNGFHHWSIEQEFPRAEQHPLEEAHDEGSKILQPHFLNTVCAG